MSVIFEPLLRVLVVDASAVVRQEIPALLHETGGFEVRVAATPPAALERLRHSRPDVVLLGVERPATPSLPLLHEFVTEAVPVVACAKAQVRDEVLAKEVLRGGAAEVVHWPREGLREHLAAVAGDLATTLRVAGGRLPRAPLAAHPGTKPFPSRPFTWARNVVAVGASTGGPGALRSLLGALPEDAPGVLVVQHMPEPFATNFARSLAEECRLTVRRAEAGDEVRPGTVLLAPGDKHLRLAPHPRGYAVALSDELPVNHHRPSVDVLFHSVAQVAGQDAIGVLLTGMGEDGASGLAAMRRAGAATLVQDAATSVVYGMPRAAMQLGAAERSLPLDALPDAILEAATRRRSRRKPSW